MVPFGYRKVGEKRNGQLVVSEDPIPDMALSEADVNYGVYVDIISFDKLLGDAKKRNAILFEKLGLTP
jgi:hypothetical protein